MPKPFDRTKPNSQSYISHSIEELIPIVDLQDQGKKTSWLSLYWAVVITLCLFASIFWLGETFRVDEGTRGDRAAISWTEAAFLKVPLGISEKTAITTYGQPTSREVYPNTETLILLYDQEETETGENQRVELSFSTEGGKSALHVKRAYGLPTTAVSDLASPNQVHLFTPEEVLALSVGDGETGKGGVSLADVLSQYGQPTQVDSLLQEQGPSLFNNEEGLQKHLTLFYNQPEGSSYQQVQLSFEARNEGNYHLRGKAVQ